MGIKAISDSLEVSRSEKYQQSDIEPTRGSLKSCYMSKNAIVRPSAIDSNPRSSILHSTQSSVEIEHTIVRIFILRQEHSGISNLAWVSKSMQRNQILQPASFPGSEV